MSECSATGASHNGDLIILSLFEDALANPENATNDLAAIRLLLLNEGEGEIRDTCNNPRHKSIPELFTPGVDLSLEERFMKFLTRLFGKRPEEEIEFPTAAVLLGNSPGPVPLVLAVAPGGGIEAGGFSTKPQTSAYTPQETAAMGAQLMKSLMRDLGITREQAAGIVGNIMHESGGLNPAINQGGKIGPPEGGGETGYGWVQWSGPRKDEYLQFAKDNNMDPGSPAANYAFLLKELKGPYSGVIAQLKLAGSVAEAAQVMFSKYEIPADTASLPPRVNFANTAMNWA
jgi:hypothetical protein